VNDKTLENGDMIHLSQSGDEVILQSDTITNVLVMAGEPLDEPVAHYGPFVMNTHEEIMQAFSDLNAGKMGTVGG
jgi:redox-sensitive bicupin YhaK (pirin superfamily)